MLTIVGFGAPDTIWDGPTLGPDGPAIPDPEQPAMVYAISTTATIWIDLMTFPCPDGTLAGARGFAPVSRPRTLTQNTQGGHQSPRTLPGNSQV
jgi:hypothetical protein